ncbi:YgjV family protein [Alteromonadaceae bacterium BrNp21-10]|nr:YgjV family protein [Alteromonadaceae bacterium BrNp21-10]
MNALNAFFETLNSIFWQHPWAQSIGIIALLVGVSAFIHKDDQKLRLFLTVFTLLMGIQFMMLGLWSAAFAALLGSARNYISTHTRNVWVMCSFMLVIWLVTLPNVEELFHLLPILGTSVGTWAMFREKGIRMRMFMLVGSMCWFSHNYIVGSIGGALIEAIFLIINSRTMIMLLKDARNEQCLKPCAAK